MSGKSRYRTPPKSPKYAAKEGPFEPIVIDSSDYAEPEREHIFTIDGVEYTMPVTVEPALALRVLEVIEVNGEAAATSFALYEVLGEKAHEALKGCKAMTAAQMMAITDVIMERVLGSLESGN
jgi:hypothetical protein